MKHLLPILALSLAQNVAAAQWRISWAAQSGEMTANGQAGPRLFIRQKTNP